MKDGGWYPAGAVITGFIIFVGVWIYALTEWGLLFGLIFGWIPALIAAVIGGFAWPLIAIGLVLGLLGVLR